jgi:hypothetical protein
MLLEGMPPEQQRLPAEQRPASLQQQLQSHQRRDQEIPQPALPDTFLPDCRSIVEHLPMIPALHTPPERLFRPAQQRTRHTTMPEDCLYIAELLAVGIQ